MRILHVATHFALYTSALLPDASEARRHAFLQRENYLAELAHEPPSQVRLFPRATPRKPLRLIRTGLTLVSLLRELQPEVVHFQETPTAQCLGFWKLCRHLPRVLTIHDVTPHPGRDSHLTLGRRYVQVMRAEADGIIVHAETLRQKLASGDRSASRIHVVEHPALPLRPGLTELAPGAPYALLVGRMEAYKGLEVLLQAWKRLVQGGEPKLRLVIAGSGPELERLQGPLRELPGTTVINRFLTREELDGLVHSAALLLAPYTEASASGVLAQAFSAGVPAIASSIGAFAEYIDDGQTGWLVPPGNPQRLAETLKTVGNNQEVLSKAREQVIAAALTRFSPDHVIAKTDAVYSEVIRSRQSAA